jgi:hypothetical protein
VSRKFGSVVRGMRCCEYRVPGVAVWYCYLIDDSSDLDSVTASAGGRISMSD